MRVLVSGISRVEGEVTPPPDKSISHRALFISSLSKKPVVVKNLLNSLDVVSTKRCLQMLGVQIEEVGRDVRVTGPAGRAFSEPRTVLYCGNSGTTMRLLCGLLAAQRFYSVLSGDKYLNERPMARVIIPLRQMGAQLFGREKDSKPPITVIGSALKPIEYASPVASAQVKSAVLLAATFAHGETRYAEPHLSRDHTEIMLQHFGARISRRDNVVSLVGPSELRCDELSVPGDPSSACFFIALALVVPNSELLVRDVCVNPTRMGAVDAFVEMGGKIELINRRKVCGEEVADIHVTHSELRGITISGARIPLLVDEVPLLALVAAFASGVTEIRDAAELRVKESDRIKTTVSELRKLGANIVEREDGMVIEGKGYLTGAKVKSHGDHRIAMMLAVAGLAAHGQTEISGFECSRVSFPGFLEAVMSLCRP